MELEIAKMKEELAKKDANNTYAIHWVKRQKWCRDLL